MVAIGMEQQAERPNVIVFFTDQQRWDTTGVHGNPLQLTPNFDRMALEGTHLAHTFTCQPVCTPARSCLQTGKYATTTGCYRNGIPLSSDERTLAHYFNEAGYDTGYIGKWHLASTDPVPAAEQGGYQYWLGANSLEHTSDAYHTVVYDKEQVAHKLPGYRVDALADQAISFIHDKQQRPFFLFLSLLEPHHQNYSDNYPAPDGYEERYQGRWTPPDLLALGGTAPQHLGGYYGMVKRIDEALGRIIDALKSLELTKQTIILFTSDHGCHFKTRNQEYKRSGHDSSIRIPAALYGGPFSGGGRMQQLISLLDLPPTLLDAAGITPPAHMQGKSIMPLLRNRDEQWTEHVFVQISESEVGRALRTDRWKYGVIAPQADPIADAGSTYYEENYLYDLHADPYELTNLIGIASFASISEQLRQQLQQAMAKAGEAVPHIEPALVRDGGQRRMQIRGLP